MLKMIIKFSIILVLILSLSVVLLYAYIHFPRIGRLDKKENIQQPAFITGDSPENHSEYFKDIPCYSVSQFASLNFFACKKLLFQRIHSITIHNTEIKNHSVALFKIKYGEAQDCPSGCFFESLVGVLIDDQVYDIETTNYEEVNSKMPTHPFMRDQEFKDYIKSIDQYSSESLENLLEKSKN